MPGPETERGLERCHRLLVPIMVKNQFITISTERITAHPVMGFEQPFLQVADCAVCQGQHGLRAFVQVGSRGLTAGHMAKPNLNQFGEARVAVGLYDVAKGHLLLQECDEGSASEIRDDRHASAPGRTAILSPPLQREPAYDTLNAATPNRRGKSMTRRSGQNGNVVKSGRMWRGRYYEDVVGQEKRRRLSVPLGFVKEMTKPEARRKLREKLNELGINTAEHLERATRGVKTLTEEVEWWQQNRLALCKPSFQDTVGYHLHKYIVPCLGHLPVDRIGEKEVQEFIATLTRTTYLNPAGARRPLSPKSIRNIVGVVKQILGEKVWRDWNITLPKSEPKEQRCFTEDEMRQIIGATSGQWSVLFATLAGTGMRAGEAFGLHIDDLDLAAGRIFVRRGVYKKQEGTAKTPRSHRVIYIDRNLTAMLGQHIGERKAGRVFETGVGTPFSKDDVRRKLQTVLQKLGLPKGGLHAFRHGRVSVLRMHGVPDDLVTEWVGHSSLRMTSRYTHFQDTYRQQVARDLGPLLPPTVEAGLPIGPNGPRFGQCGTITAVVQVAEGKGLTEYRGVA